MISDDRRIQAIIIAFSLGGCWWQSGIADAAERLCLPAIEERALAGLKFSEALPYRLAVATLAARLADVDMAAEVLEESARFVIGSAE